MTEASEQALIAEYQAGVSILGSLDTRVWSVYSVVTTVAVAALVFVAKDDSPPAVDAVVAVGVTANLVGWWLMASRWWSYGDVLLARMRDIERSLGLSLTTRVKWSGTMLLPETRDLLSDEDRAAYDAVRAERPKPPFPRFSQRRGALLSIVGLLSAHMGSLIYSIVA